MSNTVHTLDVVVEATNTKYKQAMKDTVQTATKTADSINGELGKIKNPIAEMFKNDKTMQSIRNMQNLIKKSWTDMFNGTIPKELTKSVKDYVKEAQLAAGIKVYTDDYLQLGKDISDTEKELGKLREKMSGMDESKRFIPTQEFTDLEKNIKTANSTLDKLYEKKRKMDNSGKAMLPTEEYTAYSDLVADAESRLEQLIAKQREWKELGVNENGSSLMKTLADDIRDTEKEISFLKRELKDLEDTGGAFSPTQDYKDLTNEIARTKQKLQEYKDLREQLIADGSNVKEAEAFQKVELAISSAESKLDSYAAKKRGMESSGQDVQFTGGLANRSTFATAGAVKSQVLTNIKEMNARIAETIAKMPLIGKVAANAAYLGTKAFSGMRAVMGKITSGIKTAGGAFASLIQRFRNGIPLLGRTRQSMSGLGNTGKGLGGIFNTLAMSARFMFASFVINSAINGAKEGLQNLAQYSAATNNSISTLMSGLTQLKNSLATAFAPVLNVVTPILSTMIDYLIAASNAVAQFMAAMTGQSTYTVAKRVQQDYAASLDKTKDSANGANNAAKELKRTIMGFDEINKLDDDSNSGSGGSGGGSGSGAGAGDMFTTETIESQFADFAQKIKDAWNEADFTEIGTIIGTKLKTALDDIPWEMIQESAQKVGKSLATLINGFVETAGLADSVGTTVAQALNTGVLGVNSFLTNLHWESVGQFVADSMNSFIKNADWSGAGDAVKNGINGVFTAADTWAGKFKFGNLGEKVSDAVNTVLGGIEWSTAISFSKKTGKGIAEALNKVITPETLGNVGETFAGVINTVISGAYEFIGEVEWDNWGVAIGTGINDFFDDVDWGKAGLSFSGAVQGILTTLRNAIKTVEWEKVGEDIAAFIKGADFTGLLSEVGDLIWDAINAAIEAWKTSFDANPVETTIITTLGLMKFTGLDDALGNLIWKKIKDSLFGTAVAEAAAATAAEGFANSLALAIKTALGSAGVFAIIAGGVALIYKGVEDMLKDPDFLKNKDVEEYIKNNPGSFGEGAETPEIDAPTVDTGSNQPNELDKLQYRFPLDVEVRNLYLPNETDPLNVDVNATAVSFTDKIDAAKKEIGGFASTVASYIDGITGGKTLTGFVSAFSSFTDKISGNKVISNFISTLTGYDDGISVTKSIGGFISSLTGYDDKITAGKVVTGFVSKLTDFSDAIKNKKVKDFIALANDLADNIPVKKKKVDGFTVNLTDKVNNIPKNKKTLGFTANLTKRTVGYSTDKKKLPFTANLTKRVAAYASNPAKKLLGFTANLTGRTDNIKNKVLGKWTAVLTGKNDSISGKLLNNFTAALTDKSDKIPAWKKVLSGFTAIFTGGTKQADGGIYVNGSWKPVTAYAGGGTPSMGQMFIAREAGPELVGTIGGHTAVMNNNQIVSSVAAGVYQAVAAAMSQSRQNSSGGTPVINVYVGGKRVTDVVVEEVNRRTQSTGVCPILT